MISVTYGEYDEWMEKFEAMGNTLHDYGITRDDIERMGKEPDKYVQFAMYLSTRPWYKGKGDDSHVFINGDALKPSDAAYLLNEFLNEHISFEDSSESDYDETEEEAMKKLLGIF